MGEFNTKFNKTLRTELEEKLGGEFTHIIDRNYETQQIDESVNILYQPLDLILKDNLSHFPKCDWLCTNTRYQFTEFRCKDVKYIPCEQIADFKIPIKNTNKFEYRCMEHLQSYCTLPLKCRLGRFKTRKIPMREKEFTPYIGYSKIDKDSYSSKEKLNKLDLKNKEFIFKLKDPLILQKIINIYQNVKTPPNFKFYYYGQLLFKHNEKTEKEWENYKTKEEWDRWFTNNTISKSKKDSKMKELKQNYLKYGTIYGKKILFEVINEESGIQSIIVKPSSESDSVSQNNYLFLHTEFSPEVPQRRQLTQQDSELYEEPTPIPFDYTYSLYYFKAFLRIVNTKKQTIEPKKFLTEYITLADPSNKFPVVLDENAIYVNPCEDISESTPCATDYMKLLSTEPLFNETVMENYVFYFAQTNKDNRQIEFIGYTIFKKKPEKISKIRIYPKKLKSNKIYVPLPLKLVEGTHNDIIQLITKFESSMEKKDLYDYVRQESETEAQTIYNLAGSKKKKKEEAQRLADAAKLKAEAKQRLEAQRLAEAQRLEAEVEAQRRAEAQRQEAEQQRLAQEAEKEEAQRLEELKEQEAEELKGELIEIIKLEISNTKLDMGPKLRLQKLKDNIKTKINKNKKKKQYYTFINNEDNIDDMLQNQIFKYEGNKYTPTQEQEYFQKFLTGHQNQSEQMEKLIQNFKDVLQKLATEELAKEELAKEELAEIASQAGGSRKTRKNTKKLSRKKTSSRRKSKMKRKSSRRKTSKRKRKSSRRKSKSKKKRKKRTRKTR